MKSHIKITYYFILWSDIAIGKILYIKTWMLQKKTVWPKSIKTKLWQLESLVNRYVFPFVMFMISTYYDSMNSWLIVVFSVMKNPGLFSYDVWKSERNSSKSAKYTYQSFITKYYSGMSFLSSLKVTVLLCTIRQDQVWNSSFYPYQCVKINPGLNIDQ